MAEIKWAESAHHLPIEDFSPNPRNPKKHTKKQLEHIRNSILHFGFLDPIGVWGKNHVVVEGHGRLEALKQLVQDGKIRIPAEGVPCIMLDHLSKRDRDAYMLEHNQSTMETPWDDDLLDDVLGDIANEGLDMEQFGFEMPGEEDGEDGKYTSSVNIPQYEVRGEIPNFADMLDSGRTDELIREIEASGVTQDEKNFLVQAARRHNVFNYRAIAEYYAQATPEMQRLMEHSALVIIDVDDAISLVVALSQGGDYIGGLNGKYFAKKLSRKAMNAFFCRVDRPFSFFGSINEDVNMYVTLGSRGEKIFSVTDASLIQKETQANAGGLTDIYLDVGTYVKSFYSVMTMPSCVTVAMMGETHRRMHHNISWVNCVPMILNEKYRKAVSPERVGDHGKKEGTAKEGDCQAGI